MTTAVADAATGNTILPMTPDVETIFDLDIDKLPKEVVVEWDEYNQKMHEAFSYMDIMTKVPLAASVLAISDFAVNRLMVDDIEENIREEEMDGDIEAQNVYFWKGMGVRFVALIVVSVATVVISKLTYDNPYWATIRRGGHGDNDRKDCEFDAYVCAFIVLSR